MYIPRHWHVAIPVSFSLLGWYITEHYPNTYDVVIVFLVLQYHAIMHMAYIVIAGNMYQAYVTQVSARQGPETEPLYDHNTGKVIGEVPVRNPASGDGWEPLKLKRTEQPVMNQVVTPVRFDKERKVAKTLIQQRNGNFKVDLTEDFWIKRGNFGESRKKFVEMKDRWRRDGVIYKAGDRENAPDEVADWRKVRLIADGNKLP